jgi:hypothetical protein
MSWKSGKKTKFGEKQAFMGHTFRNLHWEKVVIGPKARQKASWRGQVISDDKAGAY